MTSDSVKWKIEVARYTPESGLRTSWADDYRLRVRVLGDALQGHEVVIEGDAAGLESLARQLLALAQDGVPSGMHLHLEDLTVLDAPSAALVLEREDDPEEYVPYFARAPRADHVVRRGSDIKSDFALSFGQHVACGRSTPPAAPIRDADTTSHRPCRANVDGQDLRQARPRATNARPLPSNRPS